MKTEYLIIYGIINLISFVLMTYDKRMAVTKGWRIPEVVLLGVAALGGAPGTLMAMRMWRHKRTKLKFSTGVPLMVIAHILLYYQFLA